MILRTCDVIASGGEVDLTKFFDKRKLEGWEEFGKLPKKIKDRRRKKLYRRFLEQNFWAFVYVLGYRDLGSFHDSLISDIGQVRFITDEPTRRLWLWSRGFFKTSLITEAHSIWLVVNNPNIRILLASNTISVSQDILKNIKNHFINNEWFRDIFEDFCPIASDSGKIEFGTNEEFTVPCRNKSNKEPTIKVAGIGTNLAGYHFDYMKLDDLVTKDSVTNESQIQASKDYYASLRHLFDKAAVPREDIIGTIYHFNDLYGLLRNSGLFKESFVPARRSGMATFPERLSDDKLDDLISDPSIGPYQFNTQYMLNPINPSESKFKDEWLKYYDTIPEGLAQYILCDPASTLKKKSDYTVLQRWGVDHTGKTYLLEGVRDRLKSFQRIDLLFDMAGRARNLKEVKYEVIGGRHGDLEVIEERQKKEKKYFKVTETKSTTHSKTDRIEQRLVGQYHAGMVLLPHELYFISKFDGKVYNFVQLLILEYLQFPFTEHDDILDCQSQLFEEPLRLGTKEKTQEEKKEGWTADEWEKVYKKIDRWKGSYPFLSAGEMQAKISQLNVNQRLRWQMSHK